MGLSVRLGLTSSSLICSQRVAPVELSKVLSLSVVMVCWGSRGRRRLANSLRYDGGGGATASKAVSFTDISLVCSPEQNIFIGLTCIIYTNTKQKLLSCHC